MSVENRKLPLYAFLVFKSNHAFLSASLLLIATLAVAWFLGQTAVIESAQTSLVLTGETARLFCALGPSLLLASFLHNLQRSGEIDLWLTQARSRLSFITESYFIGLVLSILFILLASVLSFAFLAEFSLSWILSLFLESAIVLAITLFFTLNLKSLLQVQALVLGFYFVGRIKGLFLSSMTAPWLDYSDISSTIIRAVLAPLPDFSLFHQSLNSSSPLITLTLESLTSCALFLALTHLSFRKKCL